MQRLKTVSLSSNILDALAVFVIETGLQPGDRLPAERSIAETLGVSRPIVREALGRWAALGVTETRNGRGTYLRTAVTPGQTHLILTLPAERDRLLQVLEVRRALEAEAAALAAERATPEETEELVRLIGEVEAAYDRDGDAPSEDWAFHRAVYRAAHNDLFLQFIDNAGELFHRFWENPLNQPDFARRGLPFHRRLVEAIQRRDPPAARACVEAILRVTEEDLRAAIDGTNGQA
ncbi:MAG TPA: FadR/GntR family transcriptional regulator [Deinococcales bacterium]|nr:FadR/GntR family transcriptional regulator [Deinococcales bacterium]